MNQEDDPQQFAFAVEQQRAVVTNNFADFIALHEQYLERDMTHSGVILTTKCPISTLIRRLRALLEHVSAEHMANQIRWLNEFD